VSLKQDTAMTALTRIEEIRKKIAQNQFEFTQHAVDQSILRHISIQELHEAIEHSEIIEEYPHDKYGPSWSDTWLHTSRQAFAYPVQLSLASFGQNHHPISARPKTVD
jgi:hypothetical protein